MQGHSGGQGIGTGAGLWDDILLGHEEFASSDLDRNGEWEGQQTAGADRLAEAAIGQLQSVVGEENVWLVSVASIGGMFEYEL